MMSIFTRFRDIVSANISAMLDRAEDPEKMIMLMIREMEDTLIEIKAACAGVMAGSKKTQRQLDALQARGIYWEEKAELAVKKGRDDFKKFVDDNFSKAEGFFAGQTKSPASPAKSK